MVAASTHLPSCRIQAPLNWVIIGVENGLSPVRQQTIISINDDIWSITTPQGTDVNENTVELSQSLLTIFHWMSSWGVGGGVVGWGWGMGVVVVVGVGDGGGGGGGGWGWGMGVGGGGGGSGVNRTNISMLYGCYLSHLHAIVLRTLQDGLILHNILLFHIFMLHALVPTRRSILDFIKIIQDNLILRCRKIHLFARIHHVWLFWLYKLCIYSLKIFIREMWSLWVYMDVNSVHERANNAVIPSGNPTTCNAIKSS